jgi:hypothetical protein
MCMERLVNHTVRLLIHFQMAINLFAASNVELNQIVEVVD